jgi:hypothetical protein
MTTEQTTETFQIGDKVECIKPSPHIHPGHYTVIAISDHAERYVYVVGNAAGHFPWRFKKIAAKPKTPDYLGAVRAIVEGK